MMAALRRLVRLPLLLGLLLAGLGIVYTFFPRLSAGERDRYVAVWSRLLLACCGARVRESVAPGAQPFSRHLGGRLLLLNHVSWLDIFAVDALIPSTFVAKADIADWPMAGRLVAQVGTVFIERGRRHAVHAVIQELATRLRQGRRVAVFPEGTTSDGHRVLPFHGNLIESALHAGRPVVPVGLRYVDGDGQTSEAAYFVGDTTFVASLWRIVGHSGLTVELHVLPEIDVGEGEWTRQQVARQAREAIAARLDLELDDTIPEVLRLARTRPGS